MRARLAIAYTTLALWCIFAYPYPYQNVAPTWHPSGAQQIVVGDEGCLPAAVMAESLVTVRDGLLKCTWARIVRVYPVRGEAHAVCVFSLRNGDVYAYDAMAGSRPLHTRKTDIETLRSALWWDFPFMRSADFMD